MKDHYLKLILTASAVFMKSNNYKPERIDAPPLRASREALSSILREETPQSRIFIAFLAFTRLFSKKS